MSVAARETAALIEAARPNNPLNNNNYNNLAATLGKILVAIVCIACVLVGIVEAVHGKDSGKLVNTLLKVVPAAPIWSERNETLSLAKTTLIPN